LDGHHNINCRVWRHFRHQFVRENFGQLPDDMRCVLLLVCIWKYDLDNLKLRNGKPRTTRQNANSEKDLQRILDLARTVLPNNVNYLARHQEPKNWDSELRWESTDDIESKTESVDVQEHFCQAQLLEKQEWQFYYLGLSHAQTNLVRLRSIHLPRKWLNRCYLLSL